jgi:uncharacterized protein YkwD
VQGYQWKEGSTVLSNSASFSYTSDVLGEHTLTLTVTDNEGATGSDTMVVTVSVNQAPTVDAGADKTVMETENVTITGTASDEDGSIVSYEWSEGGSVIATTLSFSYTGSDIGTHTLTLTVMDDFGDSSSDTMTVEVTELVVDRTIPSISESTKQAYLDAVNDARSQTQDCGTEGIFDPVPPVTWDDTLYKAAYEHSQDLARSDTFSHTGSGTVHDWTAEDLGLGGGSDKDERAAHYGYEHSIGENIHGGTSST